MMSGVVIYTDSGNLMDAFSGRENRPTDIRKDDQLIYEFAYTQIAGSPFVNNLSVYAQYTDNFAVRDAYNLLGSMPIALSYSSGVYRSNLSSSI